MMKKIIITLIAVLFLTIPGFTQEQNSGGFIGGSICPFYSANMLGCETTIQGGYAFNDRVAIIVMGSIASTYNISAEGIGIYTRFTPWHNRILYVDIKPLVDWAFIDGGDTAFGLSINPSLRFRVSRHLELFQDIASLGGIYMYEEWSPNIGISIIPNLGINFLF